MEENFKHPKNIKTVNRLIPDSDHEKVTAYVEHSQTQNIEESLKESEQRFRSVFENSPIGKSMTGVDGSLRVNKAFCEILGYSEEELRSKKWQEITFHDDIQESTNIVQSIIKGEKSTARYEKRYIHKDGNIIWTDVSTTLQRKENGDPAFFITTVIDITQKKEKENELILKNIVFDTSVSANSTSDINGILNNVNLSFLKMWGYETPDEVIGRSIAEFIKYDNEALEIITSLNKTGIWSGEYSALKKDGSIFIAQANASVLRDAGGNFIGYQSSVIDISLQKETLSKLEESEEKYRNLVENSLVGVSRSKVNGDIIYVNDAIVRMLEFDNLTELMSQGAFIRYKYPSQRDELIRLLKKDGQVNGFEATLLSQKGNEKVLLYSLILNGDIIDGTLIDITEKVKVQTILRESEERYRALSESSQDSIFVINRELTVTYVNEYAARQLHREKHQVIGESILSLFPPIAAQRQIETINTVFNNQKPINKVDKTSFPGFDLWLDTTITPIFNKNNDVIEVMGVSRDVSKMKMAQEEISKLNDTLEHRVLERTSQLEAVNKELEAFSYSVSHDLRSPLRHVNGFVELLLSRYKNELPEKAQHYLLNISDAILQMGILIDELLKFSRTGRKELQKTNLEMKQVFDEAFTEIEPDIKGRRIKWIISDFPFVFGDNHLLQIVWKNLLSNAVKFTGTRQKAIIEIGVKEENSEYVFFIRDNGVGFDMEYSQKLFGVFQRLHPVTEFQGTGIGLANAQRIILRHGGRIWAESEPDKGATFSFTLPKTLE